MNKYDEENLENILNGEGTWFIAKLFRLISQADDSNRKKIYKAFPNEVDCVHKFQYGYKLYENNRKRALDKIYD